MSVRLHFENPSRASSFTRRAAVLSGLYMASSPASALAAFDTPANYLRFTREGSFGRPRESVLFEDKGINVTLQIWLPTSSNRSRLLVFSHGEFGFPIGYHGLMSHLASHGYAVIAPHHDDVRGRAAWAAAAQMPTNRLQDNGVWNARLDDLKKALDVVPLIERATGQVFDRERVFLIGHSLGAFTAALALGARTLTSAGSILSRRDYRFYGGILLSPQGRGHLGFEDGAWDDLAAPTLFVTGPGDQDVFGATPEKKAEPFFLSSQGYRHLFWAREIWPSLYAGQNNSSGSKQEYIARDLRGALTAFLAAYAARDEEAFRQFAGDYWSRMTDGRFLSQYR